MHRTATHHQDGDLDELPAPQPVHYAEQALLGALLLEPQRLHELPGTIAPASFSNTAHGALFSAIRDLPLPDPIEHARTTRWLDAVLNTARRQTPGLTAAYIHQLVQVCPWPKHAGTYARMIEADHARRVLRAEAQRLAQTATDTTLPHPVATTLQQADILTVLIDGLAARFPPHPGPPPRTPQAPPSPPLGRTEEALDEETLLLATATAQPSEAATMRWLTPEDFTHPLHAGLWHCITTLTRRNTPVDPVTVLWEAQHRSLLTAGTDPAEVLQLLAAAPAGAPQHWGQRILQRAVLGTAHHAGIRIEAHTKDPTNTPYQLIVGTRRALADLSGARARCHRATSSPPAASPERTRAASPPPRAGPPPTAPPPYAQRTAR
ncbi:DnaB-like helicase N-terminal domain-containing protein [Streptomyces sp. DSM 42041]|uniref:DnaB-like helicase N-terminal domain-containing protein n=1 Tax=Streptomyces hazeniae TaxID=3075538 RepID=A0ABU2P1C9_9ACTN|nr:DnaB-like helicase N-terminal domain-containing protein [Streptomyces sp. DSM 42041]MDT0382567.1 DnaB-like helicase N-terminal domain-containing protein [Streptomyces sp. DSM 42041]